MLTSQKFVVSFVPKPLANGFQGVDRVVCPFCRTAANMIANVSYTEVTCYHRYQPISVLPSWHFQMLCLSVGAGAVKTKKTLNAGKFAGRFASSVQKPESWLTKILRISSDHLKVCQKQRIGLRSPLYAAQIPTLSKTTFIKYA